MDGTVTQYGVVCLQSWAGRLEYRVEVLRETPHFYIVRALEGFRLPSGKRVLPGEVTRVVKGAVRVMPGYKSAIAM